MRLRLSLSIMLGGGWLLLPWHMQFSPSFNQQPAQAAHMFEPQQSIPPTQRLSCTTLRRL